MRTLQILLADDSPSVAGYIGAQLKDSGHRITIVSSGEEAISAFRTGNFDLILMDLEMPGIGGLEAIRQIRQIQHPARVPIIVITSHSEDEYLLEGFMAGADQFIHKPVSGLQLEIQVQAMMRIVAEQRSTAALVDNVFEGVIRIDRVGRVTAFNKAAERIFGYPSHEVLGENVKMLMPSPFREEHDAYIGNYTATGNRKIIGIGREVTGQRKDGSTFPMHLAVTEVNSVDGAFFVGLVRDLSLEHELRDSLKEGQRFLADLIENNDAVTFVKNLHGDYLLINRKYEEVIGLTKEQVIGKDDAELFGAAQAEAYRAVDSQVIREGKVIKAEEMVSRDGKVRHFLSIKFPTRSADGNISGICGMSTEITELKQMQSELERLSQMDSLTGLFNRRHFSSIAARILEKSNGRFGDLCVVMLDIDHFKRINDTYGHAAGDAVLKAIGEILRQSLRETDFAGRLGGEEFALLLPRTTLSQSQQIAERLRQQVEDFTHQIGDDQQLHCTLSLGIAVRSEAENTLDQLLHAADQALYQAKNGGRNRVACWH